MVPRISERGECVCICPQTGFPETKHILTYFQDIKYLRNRPLTTGQASVLGFRAIQPPQGGGPVSRVIQKLWPPGMYDFAVQKLRRNFSTYLISDLVKAGLFGKKTL